MRIDLMDMGQKKYGDCIVVQHKGKCILIDGAHIHDSNNLSEQLEAVLGHPAPFTVDLLIITHCHDDHIGQLPELVDDGSLRATTVLAADEKLGWGLTADDNADSIAAMDSRSRGLLSALLEEDRSDLSDDELQEFIQDAEKLIDRYRRMLNTLEAAGSEIVKYGRDRSSKVAQIEQDFSDFGLEILGPTQEHLFTCAEALRQQSDAIMDRVELVADTESVVDLYKRLTRRLAQDAIGAADRPGPGAAKNDQSIVVKVQADGWSALLAGDMQFAKAEVPGLSPMMRTLRQKIANAGPYDFVKLTHHTSYNGVDDSVLDEYPGTKLFAHTGGRKDATHPDPDALEMLKRRRRTDDFTFARTDRNGRITVEKKGGEVVMSKQKGRFNDFTENRVGDVPEELTEPSAEERRTGAARVRYEPSDGNIVEVVARVPHQATRVVVTIDVAPGAERQGDTPDPKPPPRTLLNDPTAPSAQMRPQRDLLFVTRKTLLERAIGVSEAAGVLKMIAAAGADVIEIPAGAVTAEQAAPVVRAKLQTRTYKGVVLLGGYDVVPPHRLDVINAALRREIVDAGLEDQDADDFIVWSDELYGDDDGDFIPELPVSRIPDGRRSDVLINALMAPTFSPKQRFGIRNLHRPFATTVFSSLRGGANLEVCEVFGPQNVTLGAPSGAVYLMLHGSARDATRFWGESQGGATIEGFAVENVPENAAGSIVLTGCCWGALAAGPPAVRARADTPLRPRTPESSIAIAYLLAGAQAFVGCTGSHYSPLKEPYNYYGKPLHDAFWRSIAAGYPPAAALFRAKAEYSGGLPHGPNDPFSRAVELKIVRQFTCLGLGW